MQSPKDVENKDIENKEDDTENEALEKAVNIYRATREREVYGQALSEEEENKYSMQRQKCRDIAFIKLQKYGLEIRQKVEKNEFDTTGFKLTLLSKSVVKGYTNSSKEYEVPKHVARAYRVYEKILSDPQADPFEALVEFIAIMRYAAEKDHRGRKEKSREYYKSFMTKRGEGETIFPKNPVLAAEFDTAVESRLAEFRRKHSSEDQSQLKEYAAKFGIKTTKKKFEIFQDNMEKDARNIATIKTLISRLKIPEGENKSHFVEGQQLLLDTLTHMTLTFSKTDLIRYKNDFLKILATLDPESRRSAEYETTLNTFFDHHIHMMTTLTDRYRQLYVDVAVNAIAIAAQPLVGTITPFLPTDVVNTVNTATFGTVGANTVIGKTASKATKVATRDLSTLSTPTPIIHVADTETKSEILLRYTSSDKQKKLALIGATVIAGLVFGPVGAAVVGAGGGALIYAQKFYHANKNLSSIKKITDEARKIHEEAFCKFCVNLLKDKNNPDLGEIEIILRNEMERLTVWAEKSSDQPPTPSDSTNHIFAELQHAHSEFNPSLHAEPTSSPAEEEVKHKTQEAEPSTPLEIHPHTPKLS